MLTMDEICHYTVKQSHHRPPVMSPVKLAESYGMDIHAHDAIHDMFGCIPFPYHVYWDIFNTPAGAEKAIKRLHSPERLFDRRVENIKKRVMGKDPLFFDEIFKRELNNNKFTLEFYRQRHIKKSQMIRKIACHDKMVGKLWISPEAEALKRFNWIQMAEQLKNLIVSGEELHTAYQMVLSENGIITKKE